MGPSLLRQASRGRSASRPTHWANTNCRRSSEVTSSRSGTPARTQRRSHRHTTGDPDAARCCCRTTAGCRWLGVEAPRSGRLSLVNERERFRERLAARPILGDGAMGTLLFSRGIPQRACLDELPSTRPDLIGSIHREYLEAGAELIETATFGANRFRLAVHGLAHETHRFNRKAAQVAREARDVAGRDVLVGGSIGPLGAPTREIVHLAESQVRAAYREQIDGLLEGGIDLFIIETHVDLNHLLLAIDEARRAADLPIVGELTFGEEMSLPDGTTPESAAASLIHAAVDAFGVNCGVGPEACLEALEGMARAGPAAAG